MKKQIIYIVMIFVAVLCGCEKMLDLTPEDRVTGKNFWKNKGEVETSMVGGYGKLQGCLESLFTWGELRSELVFVVSRTGSGDRQDVNQNMITKDNGLCSWGSIYSTINQFNYVIDFAPMVRAVDKSFTETELNYFLGEAKTMRALCYFYLARTFQYFPYITAASKNDQQKYDYEGMLCTQVLDSIVKDLLWAESRVRANYDDVDFSSDLRLKTRYEKGRVTQPAVWAILADVYLTQNKYQEAMVYLDKIINDNRYRLMTGPENWYSIFYPGNSSEGIFELQFAREYSNPAEFIKWFSGQSSVGGENWYQLQLSQRTRSFHYWEGNDWMNPKMDNRGTGSTYIGQLSNIGAVTNASASIWKWIGNRYNGDKSEHYRDGNSNDPNWIFYRLADIYLMKAEALNRTGDMTGAKKILETIRQRVSVSGEISCESQEEMEGLILDERAAELAFEGKRWFDLVRIARRQNNNIEVISSRYCFAKSPSIVTDGYYKARFSDPLAWYFPIHKEELEKNPNLVQNPYYK